MTRNEAREKSLRAANFGFGALFFTLFGWINVEILAVSNSASIRGQLLTFAIGASLSTLGYRRYQTWWTPLAQSMRGEAPQSSFRTHWGAIVLLVGAGFFLACTMRMDLFTSVALGAGSLTFIPWARSSFCKKHFFASHALLVSGGLPVSRLTSDIVLDGKRNRYASRRQHHIVLVPQVDLAHVGPNAVKPTGALSRETASASTLPTASSARAARSKTHRWCWPLATTSKMYR